MSAAHPLTIAPYDSRWPLWFEREREALARALGALALAIDHNGSTSVPDLPAKPVIDIQISVVSLTPMDAYRAPLVALGYVHVPHADDAFCPFLHRPREWPHTYHVHVVRAGGEEEARTLAFRDYLRDHATAREEYAALKRRLINDYAASDADEYAAAKGPFVERVIAIARCEGYPRKR